PAVSGTLSCRGGAAAPLRPRDPGATLAVCHDPVAPLLLREIEAPVGDTDDLLGARDAAARDRSAPGAQRHGTALVGRRERRALDGDAEPLAELPSTRERDAPEDHRGLLPAEAGAHVRRTERAHRELCDLAQDQVPRGV